MKILTFLALTIVAAAPSAYACKPAPGCWTDYAESNPGYFRDVCREYAGGLTVAEIADFS